MKEITKHRNERFPSVILFREDLDTIHKIISETSKASSGVKISSGDYEYDSLDELGGNVGKQISDLIISTLYPSIVLSFSRRGGTRLFTMDIDAAETAFLKIVEVLKSRRRFINYVFNFTFWVLAVILYLIIGSIAGPPTKWMSPGYQFLDHLLLWTLIGISGISYATKKGHLSTIFLSHKRERESFWSRNKDALIRGIIIAIFGALAGALATWALLGK